MHPICSRNQNYSFQQEEQLQFDQLMAHAETLLRSLEEQSVKAQALVGVDSLLARIEQHSTLGPDLAAVQSVEPLSCDLDSRDKHVIWEVTDTSEFLKDVYFYGRACIFCGGDARCSHCGQCSICDECECLNVETSNLRTLHDLAEATTSLMKVVEEERRMLG